MHLRTKYITVKYIAHYLSVQYYKIYNPSPPDTLQKQFSHSNRPWPINLNTRGTKMFKKENTIEDTMDRSISLSSVDLNYFVCSQICQCYGLYFKLGIL